MAGARAEGGTATPLGVGASLPVGAVVLGVDDVEGEGPALTFALQEARARGTALVVLHACGQGHLDGDGTWVQQRALEHGRRLVGRVALEVRRGSPVEARTIGVSSPLAAVDALLVASRSASLVVLQSHPPLHPLLLPSGRGRTASAVAARAECPVVVVPGTGAALDRHGIVVGVDTRGRCRSALHVAMDDAVVTGDPVTAVQAWDVPGTAEVPPTSDELELARTSALRLLSEALAGLQEDYPGVELRGTVVQGGPVDVLVEAGRTARLLVVARHASARPRAFALGRTARSLLQRARCPVAVVPPPVDVPRRRRGLLDDVPVGPGF